MMSDCPAELAAPATNAHNQLMQYVAQAAKTDSPAECAEIIRQALEAPGVFVFGELLAEPNIAKLEADAQYAKHLAALRLFAYGTHAEYASQRDQVIALTPSMLRKLRHLTIVSMAVRTKRLPYDQLLQALELGQVRELEDLIIDAIYADVLHGRLDQHNRLLEIDFAIGRDVRPQDVGAMARTLRDWSRSCNSVLQCIENQILVANQYKQTVLKERSDIEKEMRRIRESACPPDDDEMSTSESSLALDMRKRVPKPCKVGSKMAKVSK